ncbi:MAG: choice-of-anchor L domain-containing protein [Kofleriaceae bacterium]
MSRTLLLCLTFGALAACGPSARTHGDDDPSGPCEPGDVTECYSGEPGTKGVGPCRAGSKTCGPGGVWGACQGEVVPVQESCSDGIDNNCNGMVDEDMDADGDGYTTCGGDCCDSTECSDPALVNPGAFDAPGNNLDDDCDGIIDNAALVCDQGLPSNSTVAMDYAKAIELCQTTTMAERRWGVIEAKLTLANGAGVPATRAHAIRNKFGMNVLPKGGASMALLSTGAAAGQGDTNPPFQDFENSPLFGNNKRSAFPADFVAANGGKLPNAPGCPDPDGSEAYDPVMLTLKIRVPSNARSFKLDTNFFSSEFPEYTCSPFNDFFVVLLDSSYSGANPNPTDKNLAFYQPMNSADKYPVGVNLAHGNTGLFTQCLNGTTGCTPDATSGSINTCVSTDQLVGTGLDKLSRDNCDSNSLQGGGTGWLQTSGNVVPGEIITLRIAIWDTSDPDLDSIAVVDAFQWSVDLSQPGTVIY